MVYACDDDAREIYMVTLKQTTKYRNLMDNPWVSLLVDTRSIGGKATGQTKALTIAGMVDPIDEEAKRNSARKRLSEKHAQLETLLKDPDADILCVKIKSFLLLDGLTKAHFETVE